ncbi:hypothetical protein Acr_00g0074540 [Actinidia rufa]|uniref:Uncharacterized protein n=1 Tax=Actinidia rufa TaxID=165716 RepID=A0A7J0DSI7_9ERIC|nr:hypothetical protein Acr_00g0074540 [Actinidia rufa]
MNPSFVLRGLHGTEDLTFRHKGVWYIRFSLLCISATGRAVDSIDMTVLTPLFVNFPQTAPLVRLCVRDLTEWKSKVDTHGRLFPLVTGSVLRAGCNVSQATHRQRSTRTLMRQRSCQSMGSSPNPTSANQLGTHHPAAGLFVREGAVREPQIDLSTPSVRNPHRHHNRPHKRVADLMTDKERFDLALVWLERKVVDLKRHKESFDLATEKFEKEVAELKRKKNLAKKLAIDEFKASKEYRESVEEEASPYSARGSTCTKSSFAFVSLTSTSTTYKSC